MRARLATFGVFLAVVVAAVVSTGCSATLDPVAKAHTHTADVSSLRFRMVIALRLPGAPSEVSLDATGAVDSSTHRLAMTMDFSKIAAVTGTSSVPGRMQLIEDGAVMYMTGDGLSRFLP